MLICLHSFVCCVTCPELYQLCYSVLKRVLWRKMNENLTTKIALQSSFNAQFWSLSCFDNFTQLSCDSIPIWQIYSLVEKLFLPT